MASYRGAPTNVMREWQRPKNPRPERPWNFPPRAFRRRRCGCSLRGAFDCKLQSLASIEQSEASLKVRAATLDDLLHEVFRRVLATGRVVVATREKNLEKSGALFELTNPRARMSRTESRCLLFSALGELLWYLSGSNELAFIRYYVEQYPEDGPGILTVRAAYGPRLLRKGKSDIDWVIELLRKKSTTRRAVIPIYQPIDCDINHKEVPCTCTLQFLLRGNRLELFTHMRSNDAFVGLPGDVFAFTMIQELVARALGAEIGRYKHFVGSLHLYDRHHEKAKNFIDEGWQSKTSMPIMPPEISVRTFRTPSLRERHPERVESRYSGHVA